MSASGDFLWRLNHEYGSRLTRARSYLDLLEPLARARGASPAALDLLDHTRVLLESVHDEHRAWRYTYFYDSHENKRVVQSPTAIRRALISFSQMRAAQENELNDLVGAFINLPRPEPVITGVPNTDLWELLYAAVYELVTFTGDLLDAV